MTAGRRAPFALALPALLFATAFFLIPLVQLIVVGATGEQGLAAYASVVTNPRYASSLVSTIALSLAVTLATLALAGTTAVFLQRNRFFGRDLLVGLLTFPLAFPGVVVGFLVIMLGGRLGLIGALTERLLGHPVVFAYSLTGLFVGYLYFSIPRVALTVMAAAETLDPSLEEAARSLGASRLRVMVDVTIPALRPALIAAGAICFATSMGAFGTAFTLATELNVLPMTIYTAFTNEANAATAAALSVVLGAITWSVLALARSSAGGPVAAAG